MSTRFSPIRTLIVDDSEHECLLLRAQLHSIASVKVIGCVHDGIEALAYIRGIGRFRDREAFPYPDLMLLDYKMPRCDGMQVLRFLQHGFSRPRVILWSSAVEQIDVPLALQLGADLVCSKPCCHRELVEIIHRLEVKIFKNVFVAPPERAPRAERVTL